jgi:hypothetical protein
MDDDYALERAKQAVQSGNWHQAFGGELVLAGSRLTNTGYSLAAEPFAIQTDIMGTALMLANPRLSNELPAVSMGIRALENRPGATYWQNVGFSGLEYGKAVSQYNLLESGYNYVQNPTLDTARSFGDQAGLTAIQAGLYASTGVQWKTRSANVLDGSNFLNVSDAGGIDLLHPGLNLPTYNGTTYGILLSEGHMIQLRSGNASAAYSNYPSASHVEGKAAVWIRQNGASTGTLYHNNAGGVCGFCNSQISTLLPQGATLEVIPPAGSVPPRGWYVPSRSYVGNSASPKVNVVPGN